MIRVKSEELQPGMVTARDVKNIDGMLLAPSGCAIKRTPDQHSPGVGRDGSRRRGQRGTGPGVRSAGATAAGNAGQTHRRTCAPDSGSRTNSARCRRKFSSSCCCARRGAFFNPATRVMNPPTIKAMVQAMPRSLGSYGPVLREIEEALAIAAMQFERHRRRHPKRSRPHRAPAAAGEQPVLRFRQPLEHGGRGGEPAGHPADSGHDRRVQRAGAIQRRAGQFGEQGFLLAAQPRRRHHRAAAGDGTPPAQAGQIFRRRPAARRWPAGAAVAGGGMGAGGF